MRTELCILLIFFSGKVFLQPPVQTTSGLTTSTGNLPPVDVTTTTWVWFPGQNTTTFQETTSTTESTSTTLEDTTTPDPVNFCYGLPNRKILNI